MNQRELHASKSTFRPHDTFEKIKRLLDFEHGPKLRILDVGCGSGIIDQHLRDMGHKVLGLDTFVPSEAVAPKLLSADQFLQCDINGVWPVASGNFDLVICTDVPEHIYDPVHVLAESDRVLSPKGQLIFGVPNHFDLRQRLQMLLGRGIVHWDNLQYGEKAWSYAHIRFFTLRELLDMFRQNSWSIDVIQLNFMAGGFIPTKLTPAFLRKALLKLWPGLFSGKLIVLASRSQEPGRGAKPASYIYMEKTPYGL